MFQVVCPANDDTGSPDLSKTRATFIILAFRHHLQLLLVFEIVQVLVVLLRQHVVIVTDKYVSVVQVNSVVD